MAKRKRRASTKEFKTGAVQLARESGKSVPTATFPIRLLCRTLHVSRAGF